MLDLCAWMTKKLSMSAMKPTSAPIREVSASVLPTPINLGIDVKGPNGYSDGRN